MDEANIILLFHLCYINIRGLIIKLKIHELSTMSWQWWVVWLGDPVISYFSLIDFIDYRAFQNKIGFKIIDNFDFCWLPELL